MTTSEGIRDIPQPAASKDDPFTALTNAVETLKLAEPPRSETSTAQAQKWNAKGLPWMTRLPEEPPESTEAAQEAAINEELQAFVEWIRPRQWEDKLRKDVLGCLDKLVRKVWPTAQLYAFGSFTTGLYTPDSDFDIVIQDSNFLSQRPHSYFNLFRAALVSSEFADATSILVITNARVPLIKFTSSPQFGSFRFDVSFSAGGKMNGPEGARISLQLLIELENRGERRRDRAEALIWIIKTMLESKQLHEVKHGGLGGFSTLCLCVWFLQTDGRPLEKQTPAWDLISLFQWFGLKLDLRNVALCTANGGCLLNKKDHGWTSLREPDKLSIQHPVDLKRDLSSGSYRWNMIRNLFKINFDILAYAMLRPQASAKRRSILEKLGLRIRTETITLRAYRHRLYFSGALEGIVQKWDPAIPVNFQRPPPHRPPFHHQQRPSPLPYQNIHYSTAFPPLPVTSIPRPPISTPHPLPHPKNQPYLSPTSGRK